MTQTRNRYIPVKFWFTHHAPKGKTPKTITEQYLQGEKGIKNTSSQKWWKI